MKLPDPARELTISWARPEKRTSLIEIHAEDGRSLLKLRRTPEGLVAEYDPADLDEAAQIFIQRIIDLGAPR